MELAYLIANEDQKKKTETSGEDAEKNEAQGTRRRDKQSDQLTSPRVRSLPQKKTKVQRSEVNRLAKNAHTTLVSIKQITMI